MKRFGYLLLFLVVCSCGDKYYAPEYTFSLSGETTFFAGDDGTIMMSLVAYEGDTDLQAQVSFMTDSMFDIREISLVIFARDSSDSTFVPLPFSEITFIGDDLDALWNGKGPVIRIEPITDSVYGRQYPGGYSYFHFVVDTAVFDSLPELLECHLAVKSMHGDSLGENKYIIPVDRRMQEHYSSGCNCSSVRLGKITCEGNALPPRKRTYVQM